MYRAYLDETEKLHGYFILDFAHYTDNLIQYRTNVFNDAGPVICYAPLNDETDNHTLQVLKVANPKLRKAIISNCDRELINSICQ
jgi:hypothetical protein